MFILIAHVGPCHVYIYVCIYRFWLAEISVAFVCAPKKGGQNWSFSSQWKIWQQNQQSNNIWFPQNMKTFWIITVLMFHHLNLIQIVSSGNVFVPCLEFLHGKSGTKNPSKSTGRLGFRKTSPWTNFQPVSSAASWRAATALDGGELEVGNRAL